MRKHLLPLSITVSVVLLFLYACYSYLFSTHLTKQIPFTSATADIPPGLSETIAAREYHISYDRARDVLQSPNRKQNLRAYYRPGKLTIQNRVDSSGQNFSGVLKNEGILANGRLMDKPDPEASPELLENRLLIRHKRFTEEFINNRDGVRQNFIIQDAPTGTDQLEVMLKITGLRAENGRKNEILLFSKHDTLRPRLIYRDLQCWDARKRPLAAYLICHNQQVRITVDVHQAAYPVTIDPIVVNGNPGNADALLETNQADAWLGFSVASAGDVNADGYSDVLAGAPHYDHGEDGEGAAFLYYGSANGLNPLPYLLESNQPGAAMGYSVSSAGDLNGDGFSDIAIGAPHYGKGQNDEGAVFVHLGSAKGIKPNPAVMLERNQPEAHFGTSLALAGDINADGYSDLLAGASDFDQGQVNEGAAFVFYGSQIGIDPNQTIALEIDQAMAHMGSSVAGAGDVNADGFHDVLVGAPLYDQGEADEGGAFLYFGSAQGLVNAPTVMEGNQPGAHMGSALTSAGDVNGDGFSDIAIAAPHYDKLHTDQGLVGIYFGSATGINPNTPLTMAGSQMEENFGRSLACAGDVNGDSYADLMIAGRFQGKGPGNEGVVGIYAGFAAGIHVKPISVLKSNQANAFLGQSVASAGDVDGDGFSDVVVGAHLFDHGQSNEGIVLIWHGTTSGPDAATAAALHSNQPESAFGYSVAGAGDVDGDGYDDIIVGAPHYDNGQLEEGAAFVFRGTPQGISKTASNMLEANQADAGFGASVSAAGDVNGDGFGDMIIGAMHYDNGEDEEGAAFVYLGSQAGIQPIPIMLESNKTGAWFGCAASHGGDLNGDGFSEVVIGAMNYSNGQPEEGALYIFTGSPNGPNPAAVHIIESEMEDARLGNSVAYAGDLNGDGQDDIVAGAYGVGDYDAGAVFVGYGKTGSPDLLTIDHIKGVHDQAHLGWDVSGAGDVNADGFHDLIIGAHAYDNGDGAAYVYYGSSGGITSINSTPLYTHEAGMAAAMGESVAGAGDLDGDGYSEVIVGEPWFVNENTSILTGLALIYYGSPVGIDPGPQRITGNPNDTYDFFGSSVAAAGDVNADGYSDMLVGSPNFSTSQTDADAAFVYYGNNGPGLRHSLRLYNSDLTTPIDYNQQTKQDFGIGLLTRSFIGTSRGKLVWETSANGQGFSQGTNGFITGSTAFTAAQKGYSTLPAELKSKVIKPAPMTHVRARVRYDPSQAITGQIFGPWRYHPGAMTGTTATPAPNYALGRNAGTEPASMYVYPNPAASELYIYADPHVKILQLKLITTDGKMVRSWENPAVKLDLSGVTPGRYLLRIISSDHTETSRLIVLH